MIYLGMGVVIAHILLEKTNPRNFGWMAWADFLIKAGSIILLWPLILFIEKLHGWINQK